MSDYSFGLVLLAGLSGISFSLIGITFRIGQNRGVIPLHISMCMGIAGTIFFGIQVNWADFGELPMFVWSMALLTTVGQIGAMHLVRVCLGMGPLSPLWSAMNLTFLPVILYSAIVFSERIGFAGYATLLTAVVCVLFASQAGSDSTTEDNADRKQNLRVKTIYGGLLLLVLLGNSFVFIVLKDLGTRTIENSGETTYLMQYMTPIYFLMYSSLAIFSGVTAWIQKAVPNRYIDLVWLGVMAAGGSISGLILLKTCMVLPAGLLFTINGMITILGGVIASVIFFGESMKPSWWGTVGFGLLAVLLANL
ncbi:hypothetical protein HQ531_06135 [bacterium]|nr:hypothetical protein [bacterium]